MCFSERISSGFLRVFIFLGGVGWGGVVVHKSQLSSHYESVLQSRCQARHPSICACFMRREARYPSRVLNRIRLKRETFSISVALPPSDQ